MHVRLYQSEVRLLGVGVTTYLVDGPIPGSSKFASTIVTYPASTSPFGQKDIECLRTCLQARRDLIYILLYLGAINIYSI